MWSQLSFLSLGGKGRDFKEKGQLLFDTDRESWGYGARGEETEGKGGSSPPWDLGKQAPCNNDLFLCPARTAFLPICESSSQDPCTCDHPLL